MALVSLLPLIDNRNSDPWSPFRQTNDMTNYLDQISGVFENPSIQQIPGAHTKAIWDTRTTYDFPNNVIEESELYPRKRRKLPRSVKSLDPDSPSNDKVFENYQKDVWTAAPSGLQMQRQRHAWKVPITHKRQAEDLKHVGQIGTDLSDLPSLTDSSTLPSLTLTTPTTADLDSLEPLVLASEYHGPKQADAVDHLGWWMQNTEASEEPQATLDPTEPTESEPIIDLDPIGFGPPKRSSTAPIARPKKPKKPTVVTKRDSWPTPVATLKRPAFPRKKLQELQTTTTREEFQKSLSAVEQEKRAKSKRMLALLLPLVKPNEALRFFPFFTKREVKLLTEILEEDQKLAQRMEKVGVKLPLNRQEILDLAAAPIDDADSISTVTSIPTSDDTSIGFPEDHEVDLEINKRRETPSHLFPNDTATEKNWKKIVRRLDSKFKYLTWSSGVWTLELQCFNTMDVPSIPLYIAGSPVILSYDQPREQMSGQRPPDPLKDRPLPVGVLPDLSNEILKILFKTFPKAVMACVFMNQRLSIVYDHDFDDGLEHMTKPETFGGYRVSFMKNRLSFTAAPNRSHYQQKIPTGKRVDVCREDGEKGWRSCVGVRLRRKVPSKDPNEPNDAITMTTHAFLTALRLPDDDASDSEMSTSSSGSENTGSSVVTDNEFAGMKVLDRSDNTIFGQYYKTYDELKDLRGHIAPYKFLYDLSLIKSAPGAKEKLPVIVFQPKKNQDRKMEWCRSNELLTQRKGKMFMLNSWSAANTKNPKDGNIVAEGLAIGAAYQKMPGKYPNLRGHRIEMYSRSILWRQNFTSKKWQVGQVQGLRERAYRVWNGAPVRRIRLDQHLTVQENGYSGSPLAVKVNNKPGPESYAIFGFQNYAMRYFRGDDEDGYKISSFGDGKSGSVVNKVLMEALDHGAYEFFGSYKLPQKIMDEWDIVNEVDEPIPGVTNVTDIMTVGIKTGSTSSMEIDRDATDEELSRGLEPGDHVQRSGRKASGRRRGKREGLSCAIM